MSEDQADAAPAEDTVSWLVGLAEPPMSRQSEYLRGASGRLNAERKKRRTKLTQRKTAIAKATKALKELDTGDTAYVVVRSDFIRRRSPRSGPPESRRAEDIRGRPSNTRLLHERNPHAHGVYLGGLAVHQLEAARFERVSGRDAAAYVPSERPNVFNEREVASWATLHGLVAGNSREWRKRLNRALQALCDWDLVGLGTGTQPYTGFCYNLEDGTNRRYKMPAAAPTKEDHLFLPVQFFTSGWHLVLPPAHLATFLAIAHQSDWLHYNKPEETEVYLADQLRWSYLGLADEAYETIHELEEFGLISIRDPMPNRRRGRLKLAADVEAGSDPAKKFCYHLKENIFGGRPSPEGRYNNKLLGRPAFDVVVEKLSKPTPRYD